MQVDLREFRAAYLAEVDEHLGAIGELLLAVEARTRANRPSPREHRDLMRLLHTVKGLSAMVGVEPIVTLAHHMENALRSADTASLVVSDRVLETLIAATRAIESRVRSVASGQEVSLPDPVTLAALDAANLAPRPPAAPPIAPAPALDPELAAKLTAAEHSQLDDAAAAGKHALRIDFAPSPAKADKGRNITSVRETLGAFGELVRVLPIARPATASTPGGLVFAIILTTTSSANVIATALGIDETEVREVVAARALPVATASVELPPPVADDPAPEGQRPGILRVEVSRIDDAIEQLSSLIVTRSRLALAVAKLREAGVDTRELEIIMADNARQLRDLRGAMLRVRMVPIDAVLDRLPLVIRGLGKSTGKQVRLVLQGGGAELDKIVAERIFPALVHLLRNAVDHGIEGREERARSGKPEQATLIVSSSSRSNRQIEIRVSDDGRGIDRTAVAAKAGRSEAVDDAMLLELLCRPGFTTRDSVDTTSGRGVGMDIVNKIVVDGLGGELALETTPGHGTTFILRVPLTIAIVDAFSLRSAGERYVVPVPVVEEIIEIDYAKVIRGPRIREEETRFFTRRGETVPLVDLSRALGNRGDSANGNIALVVRRGHEEPVAFAIDRILGRQETVIRPLADPLVVVSGVSGSTDLGDGRVTLVLDLLALSAKLTRQERAA